MSHKDSPSGQQFHVRYFQDEEDGVHTYWSGVYDNVAGAQRIVELCEQNDRVYGPEIFVRDVSPWRPLEPYNG